MRHSTNVYVHVGSVTPTHTFVRMHICNTPESIKLYMYNAYTCTHVHLHTPTCAYIHIYMYIHTGAVGAYQPFYLYHQITYYMQWNLVTARDQPKCSYQPKVHCNRSCQLTDQNSTEREAVMLPLLHPLSLICPFQTSSITYMYLPFSTILTFLECTVYVMHICVNYRVCLLYPEVIM